MQTFLRPSRSPRRLPLGRFTHSDKGGRLQTDGDKALANGVSDERLYHASGYVESGSGTAPVVSSRGSRLSWISTHCEGNYARKRAQADDFCGIHAAHMMPPGRLPDMLAGRSNARFSLSAFAYWRMINACTGHAGKRPSFRNYGGYSNLSTLSRESSEICPPETVETFATIDCDHAHALVSARNSSPNTTSRKVVLSQDDLAELLYSAVMDPESANIDHVRSLISKRYRRTPLETCIYDLHQKLAMLKLPPPISVNSLKKPISITLMKKRNFLFVSSEHLEAILKMLQEFFSSGEMARSIVVRNSSILVKPLEHIQKMLDIIAEFQIDKQTVERKCDFLRLGVDRVRDVLTTLKSWGVPAAARNKMLRRNPGFVEYPVGEWTQAVLSFLESTGMSKSEVLALVQAHPEILRRSVAKNLMPKHVLCQKLGWDFRLIIPFTIYHSYQRILSQIEFYKEQGFSEEVIVKMVKKEPRVLGKSKQDLKVKLDFLLHTHNREVSEVVSFPACLCYSFESRILPRFRFLENNASLDSFSLPHILAKKSSTFRKVFNVPESVNPI